MPSMPRLPGQTGRRADIRREVGARVAKLSVVVPFHNVEDYLEAALESIARQTLRDLEVILVDDGSSDGSNLIAKNYASRDPRFHLIEQETTGVGPARNAGAGHATGEYLAFVDGDDLVSPHAYALMTGSLDKTGSDMATGGVLRLTATGLMESRMHRGPFRATALRTHVSRLPVLLQDRATWNKVYRRSFWDGHGFEFPAGLYEDAPVAVRAHVLASSVDVFKDVVYYWRMRETGGLSITERYREIPNMEQRMATAGSVAAFLTASAPALKPAYDRAAIGTDIRILVQAFEFATQQDRAQIAELAASYLRDVDPSVYPTVGLSDRLRGYLLGHGKLPELLALLRFERSGEAEAAPIARGDGPEPGWYVRYPFFGDAATGIPDELYDITSEMTLNACLDSVGWHAGRLRLEGHAYVHRLRSAAPSDCEIRVTLRNSRTRRSIRLPVTRVFRPDVTAASKQAASCYDWSGFVVEVSPRRLATLPGVWRGADWEMRVEVAGGGLRREGPVSSVLPGSAQWPPGRWVSGSVWLQPAPEHDARFVIRGQQVPAFVTACTAGEGTLDIEGWTSLPLSAGAMVIATPRKGAMAAVKAPAESLPAGTPPSGLLPVPDGAAHGTRHKRGRHFFRARIPVRELASPLEAASPIDRILHVYDEFTWDVSLDPGEGAQPARLAVAPATAGARVAHAGRELTAFATHFGSLSLLERSLRPVITGLAWTSGQHLVLQGDYTDPGTRPTALILRHVTSGQEHLLPLSWQNSAFTTEFVPGQIPGLAGMLPIASGDWHVLATSGVASTRATGTGTAGTGTVGTGTAGTGTTGTGTAGTVVAVAVDRQLLSGLPGYHRIGLHEIEAQPYHGDALRLRVRLACGDDERGPYAIRQLTTVHYPKAATGPVRDLAVFDSFGAARYACNPRAIHAGLRRAQPGLECAWVTRDGQFSVPEGTRLIAADSREHVEALAQARYVIVNDLLPGWYRRRDGQTCLQTWHGTPLKRIGLDIARPQFERGLIYPDLIRTAAANWDLLLSQNSASTPIFRRALAYDGEILESGYPRNDPLHRPGHEQRAAVIRGQLGLPADKRIILYAPTRRDRTTSSFGYRFDLQLDVAAMAEALGDDHALLLRLHPGERDGALTRTSNQFVTAVTSYPDITDLLLISDVLITDYSSVMFDFAGTGRPILLYTYDLENYRDNLRGFSFDFESQAPGPLLSTTADVIDALRDTPGIERSYRAAYQAFASTYSALDDGEAAARVVRRLLSGR
jgi:CDP-glycerol glycerophosphotransferase